MGIYLNPGNDLFRELISSDIFVDKTEMIDYVNSVVGTKQKYIAVSRPRRFGKSVAADMLCAYYGEGSSRELFEGCMISGLNDWDKYLNKFDVIRLVMTSFIKAGKEVETGLAKMQRLVVRELKKSIQMLIFLTRMT